MWAIRGGSTPRKLQGLIAAKSSVSHLLQPSIPREYEANSNHSDKPIFSSDTNVVSTLSNLSSTSSMYRRNLTTQAKNEDDAFTERDFSSKRGREKSSSYSESDLSDHEGSSVRSSDPTMESFEGEIDEDLDKPSVTKNSPPPELLSRITSISVMSIKDTLRTLVDEGEDINQELIRDTVKHLRKRRMYARALEVQDWFAANRTVEFSESDYMVHLDTVGRVRGISMAEAFLESIPSNYITESMYQTLLSLVVRAGDVRKSEELFKLLKTRFSVSTLSCNQMLLLYKRFDRSKIGDVLVLMEKEGLKANVHTYTHLADVKGTGKDITGMEEVVAAMEEEGVEPNSRMHVVLAKHYIANGHKQKAEALLRDIEGARVERWMCQLLLPLYASIGRVEDVRRLWEMCESDANVGEYQAGVSAWGTLGDVAKAEGVFNDMSARYKRVSAAQYMSLLEVYARQKMLVKGKELARRMMNSGVRMDGRVLDVLVRMYVEAGEAEKADAVLHAATRQGGIRPMFSSLMTLLDVYASKGDVRNTEKIFRKMKQSEYNTGARIFIALLQAYANSGAPAYGIKERLIADNVVPKRALMDLLLKVDPFKSNPVSDILD